MDILYYIGLTIIAGLIFGILFSRVAFKKGYAKGWFEAVEQMAKEYIKLREGENE